MSTRQILDVIPCFTPKRGGDVNVCYNISTYFRHFKDFVL